MKKIITLTSIAILLISLLAMTSLYTAQIFQYEFVDLAAKNIVDAQYGINDGSWQSVYTNIKPASDPYSNWTNYGEGTEKICNEAVSYIASHKELTKNQFKKFSPYFWESLSDAFYDYRLNNKYYDDVDFFIFKSNLKLITRNSVQVLSSIANCSDAEMIEITNLFYKLNLDKRNSEESRKFKYGEFSSYRTLIGTVYKDELGMNPNIDREMLAWYSIIVLRHKGDSDLKSQAKYFSELLQILLNADQ